MNIENKGHDGQYRLVYTQTGEPVQKMQKIGKIFQPTGELLTPEKRVEEFTVMGGAAPHRPGSTGKIYVNSGGGTMDRVFYPSVLDLEWRKL